MDAKSLEGFGLTQNESFIFLTLLEIGRTHIGKIAEKTGLHRRTIYDCLQRLEEKGLVGFIVENKTRYFNAVNPKRFLEIIHEQEEKLKIKEKEFKNLLPQLLEIYKVQSEQENIVVYKGKEGLKTIFEDLLRTGETWYSIISSGMALSILPYYVPNFHNRRIKAGIDYKVKFYGSSAAIIRGTEHARMKRTKVRYLSEKAIVPISTWTYGDKTAFMIWEAELGVLIESKKVTESIRKHFEVLWKSAKKLK